jgi:hypothetical protein
MQLIQPLNSLFGFQETAAFIYFTFRVTIIYFKSKINYVVLRKEVVGKSSTNLRAFLLKGQGHEIFISGFFVNHLSSGH